MEQSKITFANRYSWWKLCVKWTVIHQWVFL